ncbi:MAG: DUF2007 domain-containing protein [Cytophagales bacterium]|nr:DUF2007 domain-containing protein [Cytophagales bacterium]
MNLVLIKTSAENIEAHFIKTKLESEGIPVVLMNEHYSNLFPNHFELMGSGIQIKVIEQDAEKALVILNEFFPSKEEAVCLNCGSSNTEWSFGSNRWKKGLFLLISIIIPMNILGGKLVCNECGTAFRN